MKSRFFNVCLCVVSVFCLSFVNFAKGLEGYSKTGEHEYLQDFSHYFVSPENKFIAFVKETRFPNEDHSDKALYSIEIRTTLDNSLVLSSNLEGQVPSSNKGLSCHVYFSPDENYFIIQYSFGCYEGQRLSPQSELWNINEKRKILDFNAKHFSFFLFSPNHKNLLVTTIDAINSNNSSVSLVDLISEEEVFKLSNSGAYFSPDGNYAVFFQGQDNTEVIVFDLINHRELRRYTHLKNVSCEKKHNDNSLSSYTCAYFTYYDESTNRYNIVDYVEDKIVFTFPACHYFSISSQDKHIALMYQKNKHKEWSGRNSEGFKAEIWDISTGKKVCEKVGCRNAIFSPDDKYVCFWMINSPIILYDIEHGYQVYDKISKFSFNYDIKFSNNGKYVFFRAENDERSLFDLEKRKVIFSDPYGEKNEYDFSQSGRYLCLYAKYGCYEAERGQLSSQISPALGKVLSAVFRDGYCSECFLRELSSGKQCYCCGCCVSDYVSLFDTHTNKKIAGFLNCKNLLTSENDNVVVKISEKDGLLNKLDKFIRGSKPVNFKKYFNSFDDFKKKVDLYVKKNFGLSLSGLDLTQKPYKVADNPSLKIEVFEKKQ